MQFFIHYGLHFILPALIALLAYRENWVKVYLVFIASMLIDLDHLIADPIFAKCRCSIAFHPLHTYEAICFYLLLLLHPKTRVAGLGLLLHILADSVDCLMMKSNC